MEMEDLAGLVANLKLENETLVKQVNNMKNTINKNLLREDSYNSSIQALDNKHSHDLDVLEIDSKKPNPSDSSNSSISSDSPKNPYQYVKKHYKTKLAKTMNSIKSNSVYGGSEKETENVQL